MKCTRIPLLLFLLSISISSNFIDTSTSSESDLKVDKGENLQNKLWLKTHDWYNWLETDCLYKTQDVLISSETFSQDSFFSSKEFDSIDITPFLDALKNHSSISILRFKNSRNMITCMVVAVLSILLLLLILFHLGCVNKNKAIQVSKNCFYFTVTLLIAILLISIAVYFISIDKGIQAKKAEKSILCEALRVPITLMEGNIRQILNDRSQIHFIGFRELRTWISSFLNQFEDFSSGKNHDNLNVLNSIPLQENIEKLSTVSTNFYENFQRSSVPDINGNTVVPPSITKDLTLYWKEMELLLLQYKIHGSRVSGVNNFFELIKDEQSKYYFKKGLEDAESQLLLIETEFLQFYDSMLKQTLISPGTQKIDINTVLWISGLILITLLFTLSMYVYNKTQRRISSVVAYRGLILFLMILFVPVVILSIEVLIGVYSTHYGCSFVHQLLRGNTELISNLETDFHASANVQEIVNQCYLDTTEASNEMIYSMMKNDEQTQAIKGFLDFLDGLKTIDDDIQSINHLTDEYETVKFGEVLENKRRGVVLEFPELADSLVELNTLFSCTQYHYDWSDYTCNKVDLKGKSCIRIDQDEYIFDDCVPDDVTARDLFIKLQAYFTKEVELMSNMIENLLQVSNSDSIMNNFKTVWRQNTFVYEKVGEIETSLNLHFQSFDDGQLQDWLNCKLIKNDLKIVHDNICRKQLQFGVTFSNNCTFLCAFLFILIGLSYMLILFNFEKKGDIQFENFEDKENEKMKKDHQFVPFGKNEDEKYKQGKEIKEDINKDEIVTDEEGISDDDIFITQVSQKVKQKPNYISSKKEITKERDSFLDFDDDPIPKDN
jgi:hypothetical protein